MKSPVYHTKGTIENRKKLDFMKFINFCTSKDSVQKVQREGTEWENVCKSYTENEHSSSIYKELLPTIVIRQIILKL